MKNEITNSGTSEAKVTALNYVEGFDPSRYAVIKTDASGGSIYDLPVNIRVAWFRMMFPEGRIQTKLEISEHMFTVLAMIYKDYNDPDEKFLSKACASREFSGELGSMEAAQKSAQTEAVDIALRFAGFELVRSDTPQPQVKASEKTAKQTRPANAVKKKEALENKVSDVAQEQSLEERLAQAMNVPCPIRRHVGKTLGDLIIDDKRALNWLANEENASPEVVAAARFICEYALMQTA